MVPCHHAFCKNLAFWSEIRQRKAATFLKGANSSWLFTQHQVTNTAEMVTSFIHPFHPMFITSKINSINWHYGTHGTLHKLKRNRRNIQTATIEDLSSLWNKAAPQWSSKTLWRFAAATAEFCMLKRFTRKSMTEGCAASWRCPPGTTGQSLLLHFPLNHFRGSHFCINNSPLIKKT